MKISAYHGSVVDLSTVPFDLTKLSKSAVWGPGLYLTTDSDEALKWARTKAQERKASRIYLHKVDVETTPKAYIDITKPLPGSFFDTMEEKLGRKFNREGGFPFITFDLRFGSVADGMRALGFDVFAHKLNEKSPLHYLVARPEAVRSFTIETLGAT
jgi:hypothetical protein